MAKIDLKKLSRLDQVVVGAAVLALISLFLPWYGFSSGPYSASVSGWSTSYGWLGALLVIAAGAYLLLQRSEFKLPSLPVGPAVAVLGAASLGTLIVVIRWLTLPRGSASVAGVAAYSYGPRVGIILAVIVGIAQVVCAISLFRASGEALPGRSASTAPGGGPQTPAA